MKLSHAILVVALLCLGDVSSANTSDLPEWICQFDKSTMIKEKLKKAIKDGLSEDLEKDAENDLQKIHDKMIKNVEELLAAKEKEIMTV